MPRPIVHVDATVLCIHSGQAQPVTPFPRVLQFGGSPTNLPAPWKDLNILASP